MRRRIVGVLVLMAVLGSVFVAGCSMFGDHEDSVLMPLSVGNTWTYRVSQNRTTVATATYRVLDQIRRDGTVFAEIRIEEVPLNGGPATIDTIYAANEVGLTFFTAARYGSEVLDYFRYPVRATDNYWSPSGWHMCTALGEDTQVPAGTFDVIIYGPCNDFNSDRTFFVPDTGMTFSGNFDARALHLESFELQ